MLTLNYEYKLIPTQSQAADFEHYLEVCRHVWNYALRERKDWFVSRSCRIDACDIKSEYIIPADEPRPTYSLQCKRLTAAKKEFSELATVQSQVLQQVLKTLEAAFLSMWERGFGFPRFKKRGRIKSFVFPQMKTSDIKGDAIRVPKIGLVRMRLSRPIASGFDLKQLRIIRRPSGWYAMLTLQAAVSVPDPQPTGVPVGIDVGLEKFLATSSGELIPNPRFFIERQRELKLLQHRVKNKRKGSNNWRKLNKKIARLHEHINNARKDFHFKTAHRVCDGRNMVFAENLNLKGLSRGMLSKHTLDAGWGQFLNILGWVCWKRGVYFAKVDANNTSQTCPNCYTHTPKDLSMRVHHCINCGYITDRDVAAAQVVEQRGLRAVGHTVAFKLPVEGIVPGANGSNTDSLGNTQRDRKPRSQGLGIPRYSRKT